MPAWGLIDPSPYVTKAMTLFKMANIPFERMMADLESVSKHKAPYIVLENGDVIQDSTFIRKYLENLGAHFNADYSSKELAFGFALERLCENHLNWILTHGRWMNDDNFNRGPRMFFMSAPESVRENIISDVRGRVSAGHLSHGISRHSEDEIFELGKMDVDAISNALGDNDFILGSKPCGYDASIHATLAGISTSHFDIKTGEYVRQNSRLMAYIARMNKLFHS
jgi:hypothetical protein